MKYKSRGCGLGEYTNYYKDKQLDQAIAQSNGNGDDGFGGYSDGYGDGYGDGCGYGDGYGDGYGNGYGDEHGDGYGGLPSEVLTNPCVCLPGFYLPIGNLRSFGFIELHCTACPENTNCTMIGSTLESYIQKKVLIAQHS